MEQTQQLAELWTDAKKLVGREITIRNFRSGAIVTGKVIEAVVSTIDKDSPLFVEGMAYVKSVKIDGAGSDKDLLTPFVSEYLRDNYNYWLVVVEQGE